MVFDYVGMSLGVDRLILVLTQTEHEKQAVRALYKAFFRAEE